MQNTSQKKIWLRWLGMLAGLVAGAVVGAVIAVNVAAVFCLVIYPLFVPENWGFAAVTFLLKGPFIAGIFGSIVGGVIGVLMARRP